MSVEDWPITTWLALWGAITGTVAGTIGVYNFVLDRPRLRLKMSLFSEAEVKEFADSLTYGGGKQYLLVEVVNVGRRKVAIYQPEMWVLNEIGTLDHEAPHYYLRDETWLEIENPWKLHALGEGDTVTFLFRLGDDDKFVRVDVADTLARFTQLETFMGSIRWWKGRFKSTKQWRGLRKAFFGRHRPRHHKDD